MRLEEEPASAWPDRAEADRWTRALTDVAGRQKLDRGVVEPFSVTAGYGALWANFGPIRTRVAGAYAEVRDEQDLFEQVDRWVAFERGGGTTNLLDRDREFIDQLWARLPEEKAVWEDAARRVFRDLETTTSLRGGWRVAVREDEEDWPAPPEPGRSGIWITRTTLPADWRPPRRPLLLPELWLECERWATSLPRGVPSFSEAVAFVADKVQDEVIDDSWEAWPECREHGHPLNLTTNEAAYWTCPATGVAVAEVGSLTA